MIPRPTAGVPYDFNLFDLPEEEKAKIGGLPKSLEEALDALEQDHDYLTQGGVFPQRLLDIWVEKKRKEINKMNLRSPSDGVTQCTTIYNGACGTGD